MTKYVLFLLTISCFTYEVQSMDDQKFTDSEYQTYCAARKLAEKVFYIVEGNESTSIDSTKVDCQKDDRFEINQSGKRIEQGVCLEFNNQYLWTIVTPWGEWGFIIKWGSDVSKAAVFMRELKKQVTIDYQSKATNVTDDSQCPLYAIKKVDNVSLEPAQLVRKRPHRSKTKIKAAESRKQKWEAMTEKYNRENN